MAKVREVPQGAVIVDVREYPEFAAGYIEGARLAPLGKVAQMAEAWPREQALVLVCKAGGRAEQARQQLGAMGFTKLTVLEGGMDRWRAEGRPMIKAARQPWAMERQVRIVAGLLVLLTVTLALTVSKLWLIGTGLVGAGLVFAGVSNTCMMASVLGLLPWNRAQACDLG
ncbi:MAG TPA: rhodanese-like domain-containing protein [Edaphobacter sp.]